MAKIKQTIAKGVEVVRKKISGNSRVAEGKDPDPKEDSEEKRRHARRKERLSGRKKDRYGK